MVRTAVVGIWTVLVVLVCAPLGLFVSWLKGSSGFLYRLAFPAVRSIVRLAGIELRVHGRERLDPETTYLFTANHVSNVDPPILLLAIGRNIRVLAKAALFRLPLFGRVLYRAGMIPVHRDDRRRSIRAVDEAADALRAGHDFLVFAEGTRSRDGRLQPLKKGPFVMAIKAGVPVVPVAVLGTREVLPADRVRLRPGSVTVHFLEPISTRELTFEDRDRLRGDVAAAMRSVLGAEAARGPAGERPEGPAGADSGDSVELQ